jgi:hypothetical protein
MYVNWLNSWRYKLEEIVKQNSFYYPLAKPFARLAHNIMSEALILWV